MQIEILGYFIIPIGLMFFLFNKKMLFYATIFFMGFTGTSIIKINGDLSIQPSYFLGTLFIIKQSMEVLKNKKIVKIDSKMIAFIIICILSLIMPFILPNANIIVINQDGKNASVSFTSLNITQMLYLFFCFIFYWFSKDYLKNDINIQKGAIKALIYGTVVVSLLGIYQVIAFKFGIEFDKIFRNNIHCSTQTYNGNLRVTSTALEPSMLAYYLISIFALIISLDKKTVKYQYPILILILTIGVFSTSSTLFVGMIVTLLLLLKNAVFDKKINTKKRNIKILKRITFFIFLGIIAIIIIFILKPETINNIISSFIDKIYRKNISGKERSSAFIQHLLIGIKYPILGVGFGTARSKDLFSTLICNIGIVGITILILYLINITKKLNKNNSYLAYGISNFIIIIFTTAFISVPEMYNLYIWFMLAEGEALIYRENISKK